jgi:hypothetical protein
MWSVELRRRDDLGQQPASQACAAAGTYTVSVVVTDNHGNEQRVSQSVAVS